MRQKVKLAFISNGAARKATYNKRKKGIIKKVKELTTLCGVSACAIISNPFNSQVEVWPDREGAKKVIERYQNSSVKDETKNLNQEGLIMQNIAKARDRLRKLENKKPEKKIDLLMYECMQNKNLVDNLTAEELKDLDEFIEKKLKEEDDKINAIET
jgi:hypothetical protein